MRCSPIISVLIGLQEGGGVRSFCLHLLGGYFFVVGLTHLSIAGIFASLGVFILWPFFSAVKISPLFANDAIESHLIAVMLEPWATVGTVGLCASGRGGDFTRRGFNQGGGGARRGRVSDEIGTGKRFPGRDHIVQSH